MIADRVLFEQQVNALLERNRIIGQTGYEMSALYPLLGCRHIAARETPSSGASRWQVLEPEQPAIDHEVIVANAIMDLMRLNDTDLRSTEGFSILDGLSKRSRWRICLTNNEDAHALSVLLAQYAICRYGSMLAPLPGMFIQMHPCVLAVLNDWTKPTIPYMEFPPLQVLARALFGNAWVDLFVPEKCDTGRFRHLVHSTRPSLLPGLVLMNIQSSQNLPEITCSDI